MTEQRRPHHGFSSSLIAGCLLALCFTTTLETVAVAEDVFSPLKIGQVKVGGEIGRRMDVTVQNNFHKLDLEGNFLEPFRAKDRNGGFIGVGMLMDAAVGLAAYSGDKETLRRKNLLVEEMIKTQEPDGYAGMCKPSMRIWHNWDIHEMAYIMEGWLRDYRLFGNRRALEAAKKTADYIIDRWGAKPDRAIAGGRLSTTLSTIGIESALLELYEETGSEKYLDFVTEVRKLPDWDHEIILGRWGKIQGHAYAHMARCVAQLKLSRIQDNEKLLESSHEVIDFLTHGDGLAITGACGDHECWHNTQEGTINLGETCATAYLIRILDELTCIQGRSCYGDIMERAVFNSLFAAQSPDGRKVRYYTPLNGNRSYFSGDTYCCPNNYRRLFSEIPKLIYYRSEDDLVVNLYTESTAKIKLPTGATLAVRQETDFPNSGKVTIHIDPSTPSKFPLRLRIPAWCKGATVKVNGQVENGATAGSFFTVARKWQAGDQVELDMPMETRLVKGRKHQAGRVAVMRGPQVFCLDPAKNKKLEGVDLQLLVIDPSTVEGPFEDSSVRPNGLAYRVKAWGPGVWYPQAKPNLSLLLTEFADPHGKATYFKVPNPNLKTLVDDELTQVKK